jgi:hypothetical protein
MSTPRPASAGSKSDSPFVERAGGLGYPPKTLGQPGPRPQLNLRPGFLQTIRFGTSGVGSELVESASRGFLYLLGCALW